MTATSTVIILALKKAVINKRLTSASPFSLLLLSLQSEEPDMCPVSVGRRYEPTYWIDVRQAVLSLPCFLCLCPASALLHIISVSVLYSTPAVSATLMGRKIKGLLCDTASARSPVGLRYGLNRLLRIALKSLTFDIPLQLCSLFGFSFF